MKKVFCIITACLMIAAISTSCNKTCTCTNYSEGVAESSTEVDMGSAVTKCSQMSTGMEIDGKYNGLKCE